MYLIKKIIAISLTISLSLFFCLSAYANQSDLYAKSSIRKSSPVARVLKKDIPKPPKQPGIWEKYKWWIIGGLVVVAGGAAAAGGGGGGGGDDTETPAEQPAGTFGVTW